MDCRQFTTKQPALLKEVQERFRPSLIPSLIGNIASGVVAIELGAKGPNFGIVSACSSATHSIGEAFMQFAMGTQIL